MKRPDWTSRRLVLRGVSASIALPLLKAMGPRSSHVNAVEESRAPLRMDRLFGTAGGASAPDDPARGDRQRKSILDFAGEDARRLRRALGAADRRKLDEYLTGVREIEERIGRARPVSDLGPAKYPRPLGIPADYQEHLQLLGDLLVLAFQTDLTRIATFVFANDGSNRNYPSAGIADGHHDISPILLAGKANGTIKTGRHLRFQKETPLSNLYVAMLDRIGVKVDAFGDNNAPLAGLEG
jgi:Protein of unknown function (DUF1552)